MRSFTTQGYKITKTGSPIFCLCIYIYVCMYVCIYIFKSQTFIQPSPKETLWAVLSSRFIFCLQSLVQPWQNSSSSLPVTLCIENLYHLSIRNSFEYLEIKQLKIPRKTSLSVGCHSTCSCWCVHCLLTKFACQRVDLAGLVLPATSFTLVTVLNSRGELKPRGSIQNAELNICWIVTEYSEYCWLLIVFTCRKTYSCINFKYQVLKLNPFSYFFLVILCKTFS